MVVGSLVMKRFDWNSNFSNGRAHYFCAPLYVAMDPLVFNQQIIYLIQQYFQECGYVNALEGFVMDCYRISYFRLQKDVRNYFDLQKFKTDFLHSRWDQCRTYFAAFVTGDEPFKIREINSQILYIISRQKYFSVVGR